MKKVLLILLSLIFISSCSTVPNNSIQVVDFKSCVNVTGVVMESYPRQCSYNSETFVEEIEDKKTEEENENPRICTREYRPVCAEVPVQCITTPCEPVKQTFSNKCEAGDYKILYEGKCLEDNTQIEGKTLMKYVYNIEIPNEYSCEYDYYSGKFSFNEFNGESIIENGEAITKEGTYNKIFSDEDNSYSIEYSLENNKETCSYIKDEIKTDCTELNLKDYNRYSSWLDLENAKSDIYENIYNDNFTYINSVDNCFEYNNYDKFGNEGQSKICIENNKLTSYSFELVGKSQTSQKTITCDY